MATKTLDKLLADVQSVSREREELRLKSKQLWEEINPLLEEAEAARRTNPSIEGEAQSIG